MQKNASVQESLDLIEAMLTPVRNRVQKQAAEKLNEDGGRVADTSTSFQDSPQNTIESHTKTAASLTINLGRITRIGCPHFFQGKCFKPHANGFKSTVFILVLRRIAL